MPTEQITVATYDKSGAAPIRTTVSEIEIPQAAVNERLLKARIEQAIATNRAYLALPSPNAAQNTAQIRAITRQLQTLFRLQERLLDDISDT